MIEYLKYKHGLLYLAQLFILSLFVGGYTNFFMGLLFFIVLLLSSFREYLYASIKVFFFLIYCLIAYTFGKNEPLILMWLYFSISISIYFIINFIDFEILRK